MLAESTEVTTHNVNFFCILRSSGDFPVEFRRDELAADMRVGIADYIMLYYW